MSSSEMAAGKPSRFKPKSTGSSSGVTIKENQLFSKNNATLSAQLKQLEEENLSLKKELLQTNSEFIKRLLEDKSKTYDPASQELFKDYEKFEETVNTVLEKNCKEVKGINRDLELLQHHRIGIEKRLPFGKRPMLQELKDELIKIETKLDHDKKKREMSKFTENVLEVAVCAEKLLDRNESNEEERSKIAVELTDLKEKTDVLTVQAKQISKCPELKTIDDEEETLTMLQNFHESKEKEMESLQENISKLTVEVEQLPILIQGVENEKQNMENEFKTAKENMENEICLLKDEIKSSVEKEDKLQKASQEANEEIMKETKQNEELTESLELMKGRLISLKNECAAYEKEDDNSSKIFGADVSIDDDNLDSISITSFESSISVQPMKYVKTPEVSSSTESLRGNVNKNNTNE